MRDATELYAYFHGASSAPEAGDWSDVLGRARRQRRGAALRIAVVAAIAVAALLVALPALGVGGLVSFIGGDSTPLTPSQTARLSALVASQPSLTPAGGATATATTTFEGKTWSITSYKNDEGETCLDEHVVGGDGLGCRSTAKLFAHGPIYTSPGASQNGSDDHSRWGVAWVAGIAAPNVAAVRLITTDCTSRRVVLGAGHVFLYVANQAALYSGGWPYKVVAEDASGTTIYEKKLNLGAPLPPPPVPMSQYPRGPQPEKSCALPVIRATP
jgi:hypothetical protein